MDRMGIVRKIDSLGRVVLPSEFRNMLNLKNGTDVEMFANDVSISLRKYKRGCMFCGREKVLINYKGYKVCMSCISNMKSINEEDKTNE